MGGILFKLARDAIIKGEALGPRAPSHAQPAAAAGTQLHMYGGTSEDNELAAKVSSPPALARATHSPDPRTERLPAMSCAAQSPCSPPAPTSSARRAAIRPRRARRTFAYPCRQELRPRRRARARARTSLSSGRRAQALVDFRGFRCEHQVGFGMTGAERARAVVAMPVLPLSASSIKLGTGCVLRACARAVDHGPDERAGR